MELQKNTRTSSTPSILDATPDRAERPRKQPRQDAESSPESPSTKTPVRFNKDAVLITKNQWSPSARGSSIAKRASQRFLSGLENENQGPEKNVSENETAVEVEKATVNSPPPDEKEEVNDDTFKEAGEFKSRLVVRELRLHNFKSYAGTQIIGPFDYSFSAIVGPNGSGKSNVIDALLFVFGFRASKLRQSKLSALIHNSAAYPSLNSCSVEIVFSEVIDTDDGVIPVDNSVPSSRISIRRTAFKNNTSKYFLNNKGVDLDHKRFLILQGEVESIAQMKPRALNDNDDGLLEYLEDIIGTSKYKTAIEESQEQLVGLNDVCLEKEHRFKLVENERSALERQKTEVVTHLLKENTLALKRSALYQLYLMEFGNKKSLLQGVINNLNENLESGRQKYKVNEDKIQELNSELQQLQQSSVSATKKEAELKAIYRKNEQKLVQTEELLKHLRSKLKKLIKQMDSTTLKHSAAKSSLENHEETIKDKFAELQSVKGKLETEQKQLSITMENLREKTKDISNEIEAKQKLLAPSKEEINRLESEKQVASAELNVIYENENAVRKSLEDLDVQYNQLREGYSTAKTEYKSKLEVLAKEKEQLEQEKATLSQHEPIMQKLRAKLRSCQVQVDEIRSSLQASKNRGSVLNGLTQLHQAGKLPGFFGRLGSLGVIDQRYDVAITTACPALNHIVVENVETGQRCIDYLRRHNLGRASFILLDKLARRNLSRISTPENSPRLFDLIKFKDEKFAPAFYSVLQNTLVANDLEQANRLAYGAKRWRVVTLEGQVIDKSGTMTGGGNRVFRGGMSSKLSADYSSQTLQIQESEKSKIEAEFNELTHKCNQLSSSISSRENKIPELEMEISKLAMDVSSMKQKKKNLQSIILETQEKLDRSKETEVRINKLNDIISKVEEKIEAIRSKNSVTEAAIKSLQDKIMDIGGITFRLQKSKVDDLTEQRNFLQEIIDNSDFEKQKIVQEITRLSKEISKVEDEKARLEREVSDKESSMESLRKRAKESEAEYEEVQRSNESFREKLKDLNNQLEEERSLVLAGKESELKIENQLKEHTSSLKELDSSIRHYSNLRSKLSLHDVADFVDEKAEYISELQEYSNDELGDMDKNSLKQEIAELKQKTENVEVDVNVLEEYKSRQVEASKRENELKDEVLRRDELKKKIDDLNALRLDEFMAGFNAISKKLKEMYQIITMGGNAELELVDSLDPFSEGVVFSVMPPKKSWKNISNLSGGEKTLSSLALVFALHNYKPTPIYVMDEIDAALDFKNVSIVANYIKERTKNAQFIVISLRSNMFELASRLVGIYKTANMTKSVTIKNFDIHARKIEKQSASI
ncbi:condensin complex subunit Cut3 [Schizosaccharomyces japonicus yFS275]|uniref:Structural maintenance of chromosomes protein n=1 Tax=Schizosaccharomyces japonicus (strain yFS275 / FY16936) TaxID=402676 RepID=B6JWU6_SCHJY|nr:condensin complex subunit Cut3 [Schizosaccharomyces japonicus yFS275]EEB05847.2 condensin complex subunit Cut3 [Schizosaccharomyces japonicus yFS275]